LCDRVGRPDAVDHAVEAACQLVTREMLSGMKKGAVIVDVATVN